MLLKCCYCRVNAVHAATGAAMKLYTVCAAYYCDSATLSQEQQQEQQLQSPVDRLLEAGKNASDKGMGTYYLSVCGCCRDNGSMQYVAELVFIREI